MARRRASTMSCSFVMSVSQTSHVSPSAGLPQSLAMLSSG
jgi:hypothetical protein